MIDLPDLAVLVGVILLAIAIYLGLGAIGVLAFVGAVLVAVGAVSAWKRAQRAAK
jgi:hypothetical protein